MEHELKNLTFEDWVQYVFDHPVADPAWHFDVDAAWWDEDAHSAQALAYLTRLFDNGRELLSVYSGAQVNQGLWFLVHNACSNHMFVLDNSDLPWLERQHCIEAFYTLAEQVFVPRCTSHLSHLDEAGVGAINSICYMWWDILPYYGSPELPERADMDRVFLGVMEKTLGLDSVACQEGALHGLGHWQLYYPAIVDNIIDDFLMKNINLRPELREYALNARQGAVL